MASTVQTSVTTPTPSADAAAGAESTPLLARVEKHRKLIGYVLGGIALGAVGVWLFMETGRRKEAAAGDVLDGARSALESGNFPTASAEFSRVIRSYSGTDAAYQAQLGLNAVRLASGQTQLAADELKKFAESNPPAGFAAGAWSMLGGALENLKKYDEAAAAYVKSAQRAPEDYRKVDADLGAARAYLLAGKQKDAIDMLRTVVAKFPKDTPGVAEASVRLAEITKGAM